MLKTGLLPFAVLCFALCSTPALAAIPAQQLGSWVYAGSQAQKNAQKAAIKKISSRVNFFLRGRVEKGLLKAFGIKPVFHIRSKSGKVAVVRAGRKAFYTEVSGKTSVFQTRKGQLLLTRRTTENVLRERLQLKGKKGYRIHRYVFSKDGRTLRLFTKAYLARFKKTLQFVLTYKKK